MERKLRMAGLLALALLPLACATALPVPTGETASRAGRRWPGATLEDLKAGRRLYVDNCAACHNLHLPSEFTPRQWKARLEKMQSRAHITDAQKRLIWRYLASASRRR